MGSLMFGALSENIGNKTKSVCYKLAGAANSIDL